MSIQFSDTSNYKGIIQLIEKECGFNRTDISGDSDKLKEFTADVNLAMDDFTALAIQASGTWQYDDSNHTKYPIITTNLVDGQRDYAFTTDEQGNRILDVHRVFVLTSTSGTKYVEVYPIDAQSHPAGHTEGFWDGQNTEGVPFYYDKTANGIFLDPIPSYNATNGLKIYINREASYFASSDTTKVPGIPGIFHRYLVLKPAFDYARRNNLPNTQRLENEIFKLERSIKEYYGKRERDIRHVMTPRRINYM